MRTTDSQLRIPLHHFKAASKSCGGLQFLDPMYRRQLSVK
jgi:hypothetical protein